MVLLSRETRAGEIGQTATNSVGVYMAYFRSVLFLLLISPLILTLAELAMSGEQNIDVAEARKLVYEELKASCPGCDMNRIDVEQLANKYDRYFYYFGASWANPTGSPNLGYFAVNPWTGDVWNAASCKKLISPGLMRLQKIGEEKAGHPPFSSAVLIGDWGNEKSGHPLSMK